MITQEFPPLDDAIDDDAWTWLQDHAPKYAAGVQKSVQMGGKPDKIYRYVLDRVGQDRKALALRCKQAAAYLLALQTAGEG